MKMNAEQWDDAVNSAANEHVSARGYTGSYDAMGRRTCS